MIKKIQENENAETIKVKYGISNLTTLPGDESVSFRDLIKKPKPINGEFLNF